jgi:hypothetical protein
MRPVVKEPELILGWAQMPTSRFRLAQGGEKQLTLLEALLALSLSEDVRHEPTFLPNIAHPCLALERIDKCGVASENAPSASSRLRIFPALGMKMIMNMTATSWSLGQTAYRGSRG